MTDYGIDVEAELLAASRTVLKEELASILEPFTNYKNTPITRNHAENLVKTWLSFKFKMRLIGDYAVRCDIFNNRESTKITVDVAVTFRWTCTVDDMGTTKYTGFVFLPITIPVTS